MHICYITNFYPPQQVGGAGQVVFAKAEEQRSKGHRVTVITTKPWCGWRRSHPVHKQEEGIDVYRFWVPNIFAYHRLAKHGFFLKLIWHIVDWFHIGSARKIKKLLQNDLPDEVHTHNLMGLGFLIPRMIQKLRIRHVQTLHDIQLVEPSGVLPADHMQDGLFQRLHSAFMKFLLRNPDTVISPSQFLKTFYTQRNFFTKSEWQIEKNFFLPIVPYKNTPARRFLFVGTLSLHKGIGILMKAWNMLPHDLEITLDIAGTGNIEPIITAWAEQDRRVTYHGQLEKDALDKLYASSDVLLFPSICIENQPNVIAEALAHGLTVIASNTGGVSEMLAGVPHASLMKSNDVQALAEEIQRRYSYTQS